VHADRLGLPQRQFNRCGTERIAGRIGYGIPAFHDGSIGLAIIYAKRGC
jgi:hypothetical protein